jgi:hypothetical protein
MKSSTLIASYLWKDTWKRWLEQPTSPLARVFVTASLVAVATIILVAFEMAERSLRERLDNFGLDTLLVRRTITSASPEFIRQGDSSDALAALDSFGQELRLRQLFARAQTEWQQSGVLVFSYSQKAMACLANLMSPTTPVLYLSETLPQQTLVSVRVGRRTLLASVARPRGWLHALSSEDILLVPQGWLPDQEQLGWLETTVFQRTPAAPPMEKIAAAVNVLFSPPNQPDPQIQSAIPLIRELDKLKTRRLQLQGLLAVLLGAVVALVYGAIAWLEFRQNLFVGALLRSFGVPKRLLYFAYLIENLLLVNAAALATVFLVAYLHRGIFQSFAISDFGGSNPYFSFSLMSVFLWVNLGAFLSSLPVAFGLRRQVGEILS